MKYLKMLGLAAVAAAALMAFVGAGTASATELCKANEATCSAANRYTVGQEVNAHLKNNTKAELVAAFATDKCNESTVKGSTTNTGKAGEAVKGRIESLTFNGCTCEEEKVLKNGELEITATGSGNGSVKGKETEVTVKCSGVSCIFGTGTGTTIGTLTGGTPAILVANANVPFVAGDAGEFACSGHIDGKGTGKWTATYEVTTPATLFAVNP